ncbi:hypothetical protein VIGAN_08101900 [Vigna angularis var. angularis]|uniref:Uncharacterized protein n=1 Tax=Vigna angularis var. angularis TaxID=157739 RepID=A0A0S3SNL0_PHAAN|nr:hypothetical protein VIGAN_08101900 [Vigna angularis var. angularis]
MWDISPKASSDQVLREGSKGDEKQCFQEKLENGKNMKRVDDDDDDVPMDLLWEVFNEELSSATDFATSYSSSRESVEFRCTKKSTALVQTKNRYGMVVMMKFFKKFFSLNNSQIKLFWQSD